MNIKINDEIEMKIRTGCIVNHDTTYVLVSDVDKKAGSFAGYCFKSMSSDREYGYRDDWKIENFIYFKGEILFSN